MRVVHSSVFKLLLIAVVVGVGVAVPVLAAPSAAINSVSRENCVITLNITVGDGGTYYLQVWDDAQLVDVQAFAAAAGATLDVQYNISKPVGTGNPGVGLYITDGPAETAGVFDFADPFVIPDDIANDCAGVSTACRINIPVGSVVGNVPFQTQIYWAPGKVSPGNILKPGNYWAVAQEADDAGNGFYKIVLACQYVYVPAQNMQPSFERPWQGQPLPSLSTSNAG